MLGTEAKEVSYLQVAVDGPGLGRKRLAELLAPGAGPQQVLRDMPFGRWSSMPEGASATQGAERLGHSPDPTPSR